MALFTFKELQEKSTRMGGLNEVRKYLNAKLETASLKAATQEFDVFLSHSKLDETIIAALGKEIEEIGYSVYIDWEVDKQLDRSNVNKNTANILRNRMKSSRSLIFAVSPNSKSSLWMQWELGFYDGYRGKVAILPIVEGSADNFYRQEYLGLYPYVDKAPSKASKIELWVQTPDSNSILYKKWLDEVKNPFS